ncbi:MAG: alpha-1,2-fucosyltransferase [Patescibacteria group bacterium]
MIISHIIGGTGNQMFQYAVGRALALRLGTEVKVDVTEFARYPLRTYDLHKFNVHTAKASAQEFLTLRGQINQGPSSRLLQRLLPRIYRTKTGYYKERGFTFDTNVLNLPDNTLLEGFWQSEKYFTDVADTIRQDFMTTEPLDPVNQHLYDQIKGTMAIAVHVRRGDYVTNSVTNAFHGTTPLEYYRAAVQKMTAYVPQATFFVFSDDHPWVQQNLKFNAPTVFVTANDASRSHFDLHLMRACQHHVLANSSFSWWGAWLAEHPTQHVIAPARWFANISLDTKDLIPDRWEKM